MPSEAGPEIDEMNRIIEEAERKAVTAHAAHQELLAAFRRYLAGKALGKEDATQPGGRVISGNAV